MIVVENENSSITFSVSYLYADGTLQATVDYETEEDSGFGFRSYYFKDFVEINEKLQSLLNNVIDSFIFEGYETDEWYSFKLTVERINTNQYQFNLLYMIVDEKVTSSMLLDFEEFKRYCDIFDKNIARSKEIIEGLQDK